MTVHQWGLPEECMRITAKHRKSLHSEHPTSTSTKPRSRNRHATDSTTSQSSEAGSANRRSERIRHVQQRTASVNTLAMHMLQLYITQWHILSSLTPVVTIIHGEWTHWSGIADCTTVIQHWASTRQQQAWTIFMFDIIHHYMYTMHSLETIIIVARTSDRTGTLGVSTFGLTMQLQANDRHSSMTGTAFIYWSYQHTNIHRAIAIVIQYHLWHITTFFYGGEDVVTTLPAT